MPLPPRLPHDAPAWLTPRRAAFVTFVWLPATAVACSLAAADASLVAAFALLLADAVVAVFVLRAKDKVSAFGRSLVGQIGACLLAGLAGAGAAHEGPLALALIVAGASGGLLMGLWQGALAAMFLGHDLSPSHESVDRALVAAGAWTAVPSALVLVAPGGPSRDGHAVSFVLAGFLAVVVPAMVAARAGARLLARRRWLARVEAGREPRWRVMDETPREAVPALAPLLDVPPNALRVRVLVEVEPQLDPFRGAETVRPLALVRGRRA